MRPAFDAFVRSARFQLDVSPYRRGAFAPEFRQFEPACRAALAAADAVVSDADARAFFEAWFEPFAIVPASGRSGQVTAFYEPLVEVRRQPDETFRFPFLAPPDNLRKIDDPDHPPAGIPVGFASAIEENGEWRPCPDRGEIERGALAGRGLEIAYARDPADVFFAHVQGAARLVFDNGDQIRVTYAAKSGHPFTGIGRLLVERGEIEPQTVSMQAIRRWLAENRDQASALMWENRSFIFFREAPVSDERLGPVAAAKVPLEPGRSVAVDRRIHAFGTPFFIHAPTLRDFDTDRPFARLMIAQDTGTAIVGPARGDLFTGSGERAGALAGGVNAVADFFVLMPRGFEPEEVGKDG